MRSKPFIASKLQGGCSAPPPPPPPRGLKFTRARGSLQWAKGIQSPTRPAIRALCAFHIYLTQEVLLSSVFVGWSVCSLIMFSVMSRKEQVRFWWNAEYLCQDRIKHQHNVGHPGDSFTAYRSKDPTNGIKVLNDQLPEEDPIPPGASLVQVLPEFLQVLL